MIKVALTGALGRMGTLVIQEVAKAEDMRLVAGLDVVGAGRHLQGDVAVSDAAELRDVLKLARPDVLIDFTAANASVKNVLTAAEMGVNLVVGTTGFTAEQHASMKKAIEGRVSALYLPTSAWESTSSGSSSRGCRGRKDYDIEVVRLITTRKRMHPAHSLWRRSMC
jgi:4-hydroxy-tetrahydrodipicolinate reductase